MLWEASKPGVLQPGVSVSRDLLACRLVEQQDLSIPQNDDGKMARLKDTEAYGKRCGGGDGERQDSKVERKQAGSRLGACCLFALKRAT